MSAKPKPKQPEEALSGFPDMSMEALATEPSRDDSSPFRAADFRVRLHAWLGMAVRLALFAGAVFSAVQYIQARQEARIERTLALVETWERPEYQAAQKALKIRLGDLNTRFASLIGGKATEREIAVFQEKLGMAALEADGGDMPLGEFSDHFDRVVYFLNRVSSCVNGNLCERSVADDYFRDFASSFWAYFSGYADSQRKAGQPSYAAAIETYVTQKR
ncbi:MAG: hypothetical protein WAT78_14500 [Rhizobiaceae bacterium]